MEGGFREQENLALKGGFDSKPGTKSRKNVRRARAPVPFERALCSKTRMEGEEEDWRTGASLPWVLGSLVSLLPSAPSWAIRRKRRTGPGFPVVTYTQSFQGNIRSHD